MSAGQELLELARKIVEAESRAMIDQDEVLRTLLAMSRAVHDGIARLAIREEAPRG